MPLTDAERQRYESVLNGELTRYGVVVVAPPGTLEKAAAAVASTRDADRAAELVAVVRGWRDEAETLRWVSGDEVKAYTRMIALLEGEPDGTE